MNQHRKQYQQENKKSILENKKRYYKENKEKITEYQKQYRQENKELIAEKMKQYGQENKEKISENKKLYQQENKEIIAQKRKLYSQSDKGREVIYKNVLKRKSYKMKVKYTPHQRLEILDRDGWNCQCCGIEVHDRSTGDWNTPDKANIDHIIPISKGGNSEPSNLQVLCRTCNLSKKDKLELINT